MDGMAEYDEEAQAWRLLGFIIDCQATDSDEYSQHSQHSGDQDVTITETGCARYLIWAAYVNENYSGYGPAEYQYYDRSYGSWDESACAYNDDSGSPCTKMDCHLSSTSFSLLGFFKHRQTDDFMEQLFKHQGVCTWGNGEQYAFMKNARKQWPSGCTVAGETSQGGTLYYDMKPVAGGEITMAMYMDDECLTEYRISTSAVEGIIGNIFTSGGGGSGDGDYDFSGDSLSQSLSRWNSAFDEWSICHSCVAHDLSNTDGSTYYGMCYDDAYQADDVYTDDKNSYYEAYNSYYGGNNRALGGGGGESCPRGNKFECYDDAGYTSVNQCMKFSAKTVMKVASFRDISIANLQGTLSKNALSGFVDTSFEFHNKTKTNALTYTFLISMSLLCIGSLVYLVKVVQEARRSRRDVELNQSLV